MSETTDRSRRIVVGVLALLVALFAALFACEQVYNYDIWWHLRTGEWILQQGAVPHADPFSFTTPGAAWMPHYWLSDVIFALVHRAGGIEPLILFKAAVVALGFVIVWLAMVRSGVNPLVAALLVMLAVVAARFRFLLRPHIVMFPLAAAFFAVLQRWDGRALRPVVGLTALMVLWVNLHASFFVGLLLIGSFVGAALAAWAWSRRPGHPAAAATTTVPLPRRPALLLGLAALATLASPFGTELPRWVVGLFTSAAVTRTIEIEEYRPLVWGEYRLFWGLMLATAATLPLAGRRLRLFHLLVVCATAALALRSVRFVALAALLQAPVLGHNLQTLLDRLGGWRPRLRARLTPTRQALVALPLLIVGGVLLFRASFAADKTYRFGLGVDANRFPVAAVGFLQRIAPRGQLYNTWEQGGYLLWHRPAHRIFFDGRNLDAQLAFHRRLQAMAPPELDRLLAELDVRAALVAVQDRRFAAYFRQSRRFRLAYFDDRALVYLADDALPAAKREGLSYFELLQPELYDFSYLVPHARSATAPAMERELRQAVAQAPESFKARFLLAFFLESAGRQQEALRRYLEAARINPKLAFVHYQVGQRGGRLAIAQRDWPAAVELLEQARRYAEHPELLFLLATSYYRAGQRQAAETLYREILARQPRAVPALVNLGYLYLDGGQLARAERQFNDARALDADNADALFGLALATQRRGDCATASRHWKTFVERFPRSRWVAKAREHARQCGSTKD